jgi:hypothetical protein
MQQLRNQIAVAEVPIAGVTSMALHERLDDSTAEEPSSSDTVYRFDSSPNPQPRKHVAAATAVPSWNRRRRPRYVER